MNESERKLIRKERAIQQISNDLVDMQNHTAYIMNSIKYQLEILVQFMQEEVK